MRTSIDTNWSQDFDKNKKLLIILPKFNKFILVYDSVKGFLKILKNNTKYKQTMPEYTSGLRNKAKDISIALLNFFIIIILILFNLHRVTTGNKRFLN